MIKWQKFNEDNPPISDREYLISDGRYVDVAMFSDALWFVPDMSNIDGHSAITHYAEINLPDQ